MRPVTQCGSVRAGYKLGAEGGEAVAEALKHVKHLQCLYMTSTVNGVHGEVVAHVHITLIRAWWGWVVVFPDNGLGSAAATAVAGALKHVKNLERLYMASAFVVCVCGCSALSWDRVFTGCADNGLGPEGAAAVAMALKHVKNLKRLYISSAVDAYGCVCVCAMKPVTSVCVSGCRERLGSRGGAVVARELKHVKNLLRLYMSGREDVACVVVACDMCWIG